MINTYICKKYKKKISYERHNGPYRGPKGKAFKALNQNRIITFKPNRFFEYLEEEYFQFIPSIQWVRFHKFIYKNIEMNVSIINTDSNLSARNVLFEKRQEITNRTGWYPLIMGDKKSISICKPNSNNKLIKKLSNHSFGSIIGLKSNPQRDGNSFKIHFENGSILLDAGYQCDSLLDDTIKVIFVSHIHKDHTGGLKDVFNRKLDLPILLSLQTYNSLYSIYNIEDKNNGTKFVQLLKSQSIIIDQNINNYFIDIDLKFITSYHTPGSLGIKIRDKESKAIIFYGDICMKNGFLDFSKDAISFLEPENNIILLDSAFIGKKYENNEFTETPNDIIDSVSADKLLPNIFFISDIAESLVYLYFFFFEYTRNNGNKKIIIDNTISKSAHGIWYEYNKRIHDKNYIGKVDPFIDKLWDQKNTNFFESVRIYRTSPYRKNPTLNELVMSLYPEETVLCFLTSNSFKKFVQKSMNYSMFNNSYIYMIGRSNSDSMITDIVKNKIEPLRYQKLASEDWIFHSTENNIKEFINITNKSSNKYILFHNYNNKLLKFKSKMNLNNIYTFSDDNYIDLKRDA